MLHKVGLKASSGNDPLSTPALGPVGGDVSGVDWQAVRHAVVAYVRRRGQAHDLAEDVAQETLAKLLCYVREGSLASVYGLAYRIASTTLIDRLRSESRFGEPVRESRPCDVPLPDTIVADRQQLARVQQALAEMPRLRREVLTRRRIDNQPYARIAADLGLSLSAVEKHVVRGLCDLRDIMHDDGPSDKAAP